GFRILGLDQAPVAGAGPHALLGGLFEREEIDMRRNAPHRPPVAPGGEELRLAVLEPRMLPRRQQGEHLALQRRYPRRIAAVEAEGQLDELALVVLPLDGMDRDRAGRMCAHGWFPG